MAQMHDVEKFKCEFENCDKEYPSRSELKGHIRSIHGYQFKCDECDREYLDTHELNQHNFKDHKKANKYLKNVHEGGSKKYQCPSCNKNYHSSNNFKYHIKVAHEGVKVPENMIMYIDGKYKCKMCDSFN